MKRAVVTGASGFIGSRLVHELRLAGYRVAAIGRRSPQSLIALRRGFIEGSDYICESLDDPDKIAEQLYASGYHGEALKFVFHLAWGGLRKMSDLDVDAQCLNIVRTLDMYQISHRLSADRFIYCGTMEEAFARMYTSLDYKSSDKYNRHVVYALAKISARDALREVYAGPPTDLLFATNSHVIGPGDDKDSFLQVSLQRILSAQAIQMSSGQQRFDVINVADCARAYVAIAERGKNGVSYWIGSGASKLLREYVEEMVSMFPPVEVRFGAVMYNDVELAEEVFDVSSLVNDTGYLPSYSFSESINELAAYLAEKTFYSV
jgi:nucleoside-diphosphate-sugar epimerase